MPLDYTKCRALPSQKQTVPVAAGRWLHTIHEWRQLLPKHTKKMCSCFFHTKHLLHLVLTTPTEGGDITQSIASAIFSSQSLLRGTKNSLRIQNQDSNRNPRFEDNSSSGPRSQGVQCKCCNFEFPTILHFPSSNESRTRLINFHRQPPGSTTAFTFK